MTASSGQRLDAPSGLRTLWASLVEVADRVEDKEALVCIDTDGREFRVTYRELVDHARALSAGLARIGVRRGDRLAIWMTNRTEWIYTFFAAMRLGATLVPINTWFTPSEVAYVLGQSRSHHLLLLDRFRKLDFTTTLTDICPDWIGSRAGRLSSPALPDLRSIIIAPRDGVAAGRDEAFDIAVLLEAGQDRGSLALADELAEKVRPEDLALIIFTSGSTGFPKGAMLEQGGVVLNGLRHSARLQVTDGNHRWFSPLPFFHAGGSIWGLMTTLMRGSTLVFVEAWDPRLAYELLDGERCTGLLGVPATLRDLAPLLRDGGRKLSSLEISIAADRALAAQMRDLVPSITTIFNPFGMTETYGAVAVSGPDDTREQQDGTCGRIFDGVECKVVEPGTDREVGAGVSGEVLLRGPIMRGYWDRPDETARAIDADGWLHTGDLASVDADGYVTYQGRIRAMLKVGGENVSAEEVENTLVGHPAVFECVLVGIPHPRKDQVGRCYVVCESGHSVTESELRSWCAGHLAAFKVPEEFVFVVALPHTGSGKVDRAAVQRISDSQAPIPVGREGPLPSADVNGR